MRRTITVQEAGECLSDLITGVHERGDEVVIQQDGQTVGVLIPPARYRQIESARQGIKHMLGELLERGSTVDPDEAERIALEVTRAVRAEQPARRQRDGDRASE